MVEGALDAARTAFADRDWAAAFHAFQSAETGGSTMSPEDWFAMADAAWWIGEIDVALDAWKQAHLGHLRAGDAGRAAMAAMYIAAHSIERGDTAAGSGWMQRSHRLLDDVPEGVEHGYPKYFEVFDAMGHGEPAKAAEAARQMQAIGRRFGDANLVAMGLVGEGRSQLKEGHVTDGLALLDEAMVCVLSDALHPVWAGAVYCHLMDACHELGELRRAREWTEAATRWCQPLSDAALYRGICRVHRAQVLQLRGDWNLAEEEASRACAGLRRLHPATVAEAQYEIGEIRRLRGDLDGAEQAFRRAHELGRDPLPGIALLRLAQGHIESAAISIATALDSADEPLGRARLLAAQVPIALAADDLACARAAADELDDIATRFGSSGLAAAACEARGSVLAADGDRTEALRVLRAACQMWQELDARHATAKVRVLLADTYAALGDTDGAQLELDAARAAFDQLGARLDLDRIDRGRRRVDLPAGLTQREAEVLRLVAVGSTNREIAESLFISEKTVHRHVSNIFVKLGVTSRTAAAAFAFEHGIASAGG
jgi:DNA-binding NarL/FixJ family response regulator